MPELHAKFKCQVSMHSIQESQVLIQSMSVLNSLVLDPGGDAVNDVTRCCYLMPGVDGQESMLLVLDPGVLVDPKS